MRVLDEGVVVAEGGALLEVLLLELRVLGLFFFDGPVYSGVVDGGLDRVDLGLGRLVVLLVVIVGGLLLLLLFFLVVVHLLP